MKKQKIKFKKLASEIADIEKSTISETEKFIKIEEILKDLSEEDLFRVTFLVEQLFMGKND